jgi:exonuclease VII small subunit
MICAAFGVVAGKMSATSIDNEQIESIVAASSKQSKEIDALLMMNKTLAISLERSRQTIELAQDRIAELQSVVGELQDDCSEIVYQNRIKEIDFELKIKTLQASVEYLETKNEILADSVAFYRNDRDALHTSLQASLQAVP